jgi:hypothetical protein
MGNIGELAVYQQFLLYILLLWSLFWKGLALWRAAKENQRNWFIVILLFFIIINTLGILEIIYLFRFAKKRMTLSEIKRSIHKAFYNPQR